MDDIIGMAQYEDIHTLGISNMREVEDLNKALEAGHTNPVAGTGGGSALRVESLEASLKVLTHQAKHCAFWQKVPKLPAYSTVEEYNQLAGVGGDSGAFLPEGTLPETEDSSYNRAVELVKFMGTTRSVSHPMTLVRTSIGDVIAQENTNGILWILKNLERYLFEGNADMCYLGSATDSTHREGVEFNGLGKQIDTGNILDLKGAALSEANFDTAAQMVASNYGIPTDVFYSFGAHEAFCKGVIPAERINMPTGADGITVGTNISGVNTPFGRMNLNPDVFLNTNRIAPTAATSTKAPEAPASLGAAAMAGATGVWATHGGAGTYGYSVSAVNRYGESAAVAITSALVVGADDLAKASLFTITNAASITNAPESYNLYKTAVNGTVKYLVARIAASSIAGSGTTTYSETGAVMGNTSTAFIGEMTPQVLAVKQLAPLMKMDLATLAPSIRWMILCYLTFILYAPKKWVKCINVGQ
ncbi:MAG: hypothetical protein JEZ11_24620 [Desulfobacterales bacterium]|nr:hypothetical protein [Desulfobacterales bacterium]